MVIWEEDIHTYLQHHIAAVTWQLQMPRRGFSSAPRFIARSPRGNVFVKLGGDYRRLQILSDADLTPLLLAGGPFGDTSIIVQEFVDGYHPSRQWYATNAGTWARLMHTLYQLSELRETLHTNTDETYQSLVTRYTDQVTAIYNPSNLSPQEQYIIETLLTDYASRTPFIQGSGLVPVHGDPSADNVLITSKHAYLVDWDTLHLSEPIRKLGIRCGRISTLSSD
jgi:aminoglycoside phosphotransferase (APT) family kinase protein